MSKMCEIGPHFSIDNDTLATAICHNGGDCHNFIMTESGMTAANLMTDCGMKTQQQQVWGNLCNFLEISLIQPRECRHTADGEWRDKVFGASGSVINTKMLYS